MGPRNTCMGPADLDAHCYRLTERGRACVSVVAANGQTLGSLSRYMHDVLALCGSGTWFEQLRQFVPPRSLEETLRSLLALDLIEVADVANAPAPVRRERRLRIREHAPHTDWVTSGASLPMQSSLQ